MALFVWACEDPNSAFDITSPQAVISVDTLEAHREDIVTLNARLSDDSGIKSYTFEYGNWSIITDTIFQDCPRQYDFLIKVAVPTDAQTDWTETYQKNDGSTFLITQTYHKLSLTFYDAVKNKNVVYFYIKVLP